MQKLQRHDLTFQITRGGEEKSQPQRRLFLSAESALKSCLDFTPFTLPSLLFGKSFLLFRPVSRLRASSEPYSVELLRDGLDGAKMVVKGNFVERVCSFLPFPLKPDNVGEEFSRSPFHRSCFENLIIFFFFFLGTLEEFGMRLNRLWLIKQKCNQERMLFKFDKKF